MNRLFFTGFMMIFMILQMQAQSPEAIKYQAVARDNGGNIIALQVVRFRLSIHQGSDTGPVVYSEWQLKLTNAFGLANLELGTGNIIYGDFSVINWGSGSYFMRTEMDPTGGTSFQLMGTTQLLSVPYALFAKTAGSGGSIQTLISDTDGDTRVETEKAIDDDFIHFYLRGIERVTIDTSGNIGIGSTAPKYPFHMIHNMTSFIPSYSNDIEHTSINLSGNNNNITYVNGKVLEITNNVNSTTGFYLSGGEFKVINSSNATNPATTGLKGIVTNATDDEISMSQGVYGESYVGSSGNCYTGNGVQGYVHIRGNAHQTNSMGLWGEVAAYDNSISNDVQSVFGRLGTFNNASIAIGSCFESDIRIHGGTIASLYGLRIPSPQYTAGTVNNAYGIYLEDPGIAATNFTFYSADGDNYFGGDVGIGTFAPASKLSVGSGSEFQVDGNGNITKINNVATSFPSSQGSGGSILTNDGSGNLNWNNLAIPTPDGGFAVLMIAGEDLVRGNVVRFFTNGKAYKTNPAMAQIVGGVVYQDATANNPVYIVVSGQAYVLFEVAVPGGAIWAGVSHSGGLNNPGQAYPLAVPPTTTSEHDREVGFPLGISVSPGLVKCMLNFR